MNKIFKLTLGLLLFTTLAYADFTPPGSAYVPDAFDVLLCHWDEADTSTTTDDASNSNHTISNNGNVQTDDGRTKFGNTSLFDGTEDFWSIADHDDFSFGTGSFTIDWWMYVNSMANSSILRQAVDGNNVWYIEYTAAGRLFLVWNYAAAEKGSSYTANGVITSGAWHHYAYVKTGSTAQEFYIDGTHVATTDAAFGTNDVGNLAANLAIGAYLDGTTAFNGWLEELRIGKGVARDFITASGKQFIMITKFINNLNPNKIGTPAWSCKIKAMKWWKNWYWNNILKC